MASDLSLHEALYWEKLPGGRVLCGLCPRQCVLRHGERGECRVRVNFDGSLYSLVFGKAVALHIDPIEKKPLFHFLPGTPILSVATAGCNLRCRFCQNWSISQAFPEKARHENLSPEQLVALANQKGIPSIAYTYTEPAIFYEYMLATAKLARAEGIKNVMVTCGYLNEEPLRELAQYLDGANVDLKGFSEDFYANYCGAKLQPVLDAIRFLYQQKVYIEITNLLIPGGNDDPEMIRKMCRWIIQETGSEVPLHFSRYHPDYKMERPGPTPLKTLRMAAKIAREEGLQFVYIGNVPLSEEGGVNGEETYCPKCNKLLLKRYGYFLQENHLVDGACPECGEVISGVWQPDKGQMQE
ncbi:MAG: AmmeMemoRadiSam system radical SAM enzyme [Planctomycetes bacterium]|nr:AmmeMemoRadiSam system radical SAM enzyme [Planctomycetota bacterium]